MLDKRTRLHLEKIEKLYAKIRQHIRVIDALNPDLLSDKAVTSNEGWTWDQCFYQLPWEIEAMEAKIQECLRNALQEN